MHSFLKACFLSVIVISGCDTSVERNIPAAAKTESTNPETPQLFLPGLVSTGLDERDMAIAPDGSAFYYSIVAPRNTISVIVFCDRAGTGWTDPEVAPFSGRYSDLEPAFSPDGKRLYFISKRPLEGEGEPKDWDIWYVERQDLGWSQPVNVGAPVNTEKDEYYPSLASNGNLYFTAAYENSRGREDIYMSRLADDGQYQNPVSLDTAINTAAFEFNAFVAPDESFLIFSSFGRADEIGGGDLYLSERINGAWQPARNLGPKINSSKLDYCPFVDAAGSQFYFTSQKTSIQSTYPATLSYEKFVEIITRPGNGSGDIYSVPFTSLK